MTVAKFPLRSFEFPVLMAMASSPPLDRLRSSNQAPTHLPLSTSCRLFSPPPSAGRWHRPCPATPREDTPASVAAATPLTAVTISGCTRASTELSVVGSPQKRSFYSAFHVNEEIVEDDGLDECIQHPEKRTRRLSVAQVKALEKAFELDNRLEPERKEQLARELDLQPRQVAVWFQNRRARWKTKQMEKDYYSLKKKLDSLKVDRDNLMKEKEKLEAEVIRLRNDVRNRNTGKLEQTTETGRNCQSEMSSCVTLREYFEHVEPTSSHDLKEKDRSSTTYDSDGSGIDDNSETPIKIESGIISVETPTRSEDRGTVSMPRNVIKSADTSLTQAEANGFLELPDLYQGKIACCPRVVEDFFSAEVENYSGFVPYDWWDAN